MTTRRHFLFSLVAAGCSRAGTQPELTAWSWPAMGTTFKVFIREQVDSVLEQVLKDEVERLEQIFSVHRPDSEVHHFMHLANAQPGKFQSVSDELLHLLKVSEEVSVMTDRAFDITIGSLTTYWRYCFASGIEPDPQRISELKKRVGAGQVYLRTKSAAFLPKAGQVALDFGGIAKGYAADRVLALLKQQGVKDVLIDFGGELLAGEGEWQVKILNEKGTAAHRFTLSQSALSTSGDLYQQNVSGKSHVVSLRSPAGEKGGRSVTLQATSSTRADALATALRVNPDADWLKELTLRHWIH